MKLHFLKYKILILFVICYGLNTQAQTKFEREYRIKVQEVPKSAISFMDQGFSGQKIKWYAEESHEGKTFEAKTYYEKHKYSIEFDTLGNILDVEKKVSFNSLENDLKNKITNTLQTLFVKHKVLKTQIQWKGNQKELLQIIQNQYQSENYELYEIVVKARKKKAFKMYEVLLDSDAKAISVLEIVQRTSDNLEF